MTLDFEKNVIHFINENHSFEYFCEFITIILNIFINQFTIQIVSSECWYLLKTILRLYFIGKDQLAIASFEACQDASIWHHELVDLSDHIIVIDLYPFITFMDNFSKCNSLSLECILTRICTKNTLLSIKIIGYHITKQKRRRILKYWLNAEFHIWFHL